MKFEKVIPIINGEMQSEDYWEASFGHRTIYSIKKVDVDLYCCSMYSSSWYRYNLEDAKYSCEQDWIKLKEFMDKED